MMNNHVRRWIFGLASTVLVASLACGGASESSRRQPTGPEIVPGGAIFKFRDKGAKKVYLVGDFNDWTPSSDPMTDENDDGEWTLFYPLAAGTYQYKFVVDGKEWVPDPTNSVSVPDGFNGRNSVLTVPAGNPNPAG